MAKHEELVGMESRAYGMTHVASLMEDETHVRTDYEMAGANYKVMSAARCAQAMHEMTGHLFRIWNEHLTSQAGRKNPRYWRGSRMA